MRDPRPYGLRWMTPADAALFAAWEKNGRPYPWTEAQFLETSSAPASRTVVLEEHEKPVGFAVVSRVEEEAYLLNLMVDPNLRRAGHGRMLLRRTMDWALASGASEMVLDVDPANNSAAALYKAAGFAVLERRKASYPRGEDALIMKIKL